MSFVKNFFCGTVRFSVFGLPISCINKLRPFRPMKITVKCDMVSFTVPLLHAPAVKRLVSNFEWKAVENKNIFRGVNFMLSRMAMSVAVLVCTVAFFILDMGVYDIRVAGASEELTAEVYSYLESQGVKKFILKSAAAKKDIAAGVVAEFPNISHANVRLSGNTLVVSVVESENNPVAPKHNVYARYDAVIRTVIAASGTPAVEIGDVVRRGDLLVSDAYPHTVAVLGEVAFKSGDKIIRLDISII